MGRTYGKQSSKFLYILTYSWVESEARRVLREVLGVREKERRQEVTPPVACARRARVEVSDDDDDDDDDDNRVGVGAAA